MKYLSAIILCTLFFIISCTMIIDELLEYPQIPFGTSKQATIEQLKIKAIEGIDSALTVVEPDEPDSIFSFVKIIAGNPCSCSYYFQNNSFVALKLHYGFNVKSEKAADIVYNLDGDVKKFPVTDLKSLADLYHSISVAFEHKYNLLTEYPDKKQITISKTNIYAEKKGLFRVVMIYYYSEITAWLDIAYYETAYLQQMKDAKQ